MRTKDPLETEEEDNINQDFDDCSNGNSESNEAFLGVPIDDDTQIDPSEPSH
jgi:hypothetical protein